VAKTTHSQLQTEANEEMPAGISGLQGAKDVRLPRSLAFTEAEYFVRKPRKRRS